MRKQHNLKQNPFANLFFGFGLRSFACAQAGTVSGLILAVALLCVGSLHGAAQVVDDCKLEVEVSFFGKMCAATPYTISLNGAVASGNGVACAFVTDTNVAKTNLILNKTYSMTACCNICSSHIYLDAPDGYTIYINGEERTTIDTLSGDQGTNSGPWEVVVRKECSCGDQEGARMGSVDWSMSMGSLTNGGSAESIFIREKMLSTAIYTPAALIYSPPGLTNQVDVVRNPDGSLRQIYAPENLADVVVINANEYEIRLYPITNVGTKTAGLYPVTGAPTVVWKFKNPNPLTTNRLQITKTQGAMVDTAEYTWDQFTDAWALTQGGANGTRVETQTVSYLTPYSRAVTVTVKDGNGIVAAKTTRVYYTFPFGERMTSLIKDPDGAALTTTYAYHENAQAIHKYGKLLSVSNPDGSWEKYDYDIANNLSVVLRPWKDVTLANADQTNCRATHYTYSFGNDRPIGVPTYLERTLGQTRELIEGKLVRQTNYGSNRYQNGAPILLNGQPVVEESRSEHNVSVTSAGVATLLQENTFTVRYAVTADQLYRNRVARMDFPDGRRDTYAYEKGDWVPNTADPSLSVFTPNPAGLSERDTVTHGTTTTPNGIANKTTREMTIRDQCGRTVMTETYVYNGATYERVGWTASTFDPRGHLLETKRHNGQVMTAVWNGDLKQSDINENGEETTYTYDALMRVKTQTKKGVAANGSFPAQVDIVTTFNYDAEGRGVSQVVTGGALSINNSSLTVRDVAGRVIRSTDSTGLVTTTEYANGGRTITVRRPGGFFQTTDKYLDGQIKSVTGSAVVTQTYDYGAEEVSNYYAALPWTQVYIGPSGAASPRWSRTYTDWRYHKTRLVSPGFTGTNLTRWFTYNDKGQLISEENKAGTVRTAPDRLYEYDSLGRQVRSGSDNNNSGTLTLASLDQVNDTDTAYEKVGSDWFRTTTAKTYLTDSNATPTTLQIQKERLNNFTTVGSEKIVSESFSIDVSGNQAKGTTLVDRAAKKVRNLTDTPDSTQDAETISLNGLMQSSKPATPRNATTYGYDALGRQTTVTDPAAGVMAYTYDATTGRMVSVSKGGKTTTVTYYPANHASAGQVMSEANAANKKVYYEYSARGETIRTWGDATYPLEYVYNSYGEKTEMRTYRAGNGWAGATWPGALAGTADVTTWIYHGATGLMTTERDAANKDTVYTYDAAGRVLTRTLARLSAASAPIVTTYAYLGNALELSSITYSDGTPNVSFSYDRNGRQQGVTDAAGTRTRTFNVANSVLTEQFTVGLQIGIQVTNGYDTFLRRQSLSAAKGATTLVSQTYGYDVYGRKGTVTSGAQTATYAYYPTTDLLNTTTYIGGTNLGRAYDSFGRLQAITTTPAAGGAVSYTYQYDNLGRREKVTREDASYWNYGYDDRHQLLAGKKYFSDLTPVAGMQFEYGYDNIGNRQATKTGGNDLGTGFRNASYTANNLNQYTQRSVPGAFDVLGTAATGATVTVNTQAAYRKNDYFQKEISVSNAGGPVYQQIDVVGAKNNVGGAGEDAVTTQSGKVYVPQATEAYIYDFDGNMTQDGRWTYTWDAENRLTSMTAIAAVPATAKRKLEFKYDYMGRRIEKNVYDWNSGTSAYGTLPTTTWFIYDGWNLIAETDALGVFKRSYVWGQGGAAGIGGLLLTNDASNSYQVGYDGSGNVAMLIKVSIGAAAAIYEYDGFGNTLRAQGEAASANAIRYSTKYTDTESGLVYYGLRYYQPETGRWIGRDPIGVKGGLNTYAFVANSTPNYVDSLGMILIAIDGSGMDNTVNSKNWMRAHTLTGLWRSHVRNFYDHYPSNQRWYTDGVPGDTASQFWSAQDADIRNGYQYLVDQLQMYPDEPIDMVGYSRGGAAVMEIARKLKEGVTSGKKKLCPKVRFMGLYDPVDNAYGPTTWGLFNGSDTWAEAVPDTVKNVTVVFAAGESPWEDPWADMGPTGHIRSRYQFNRVGESAEDPTKTNYHSYSLFATHAAMGGDPWTGDRLPGHSQANDYKMAPIIDMYIRSAAISAYVPIRFLQASDYGFR
jgi:RHS repeat-associated protein